MREPESSMTPADTGDRIAAVRAQLEDIIADFEARCRRETTTVLPGLAFAIGLLELKLAALPPDALSGGWQAQREAVDALLRRRGALILETVRDRDREMGYQVGMLLGDIARILNVNDPSLPAVPLPSAVPETER